MTYLDKAAKMICARPFNAGKFTGKAQYSVGWFAADWLLDATVYLDETYSIWYAQGFNPLEADYLFLEGLTGPDMLDILPLFIDAARAFTTQASLLRG